MTTNRPPRYSVMLANAGWQVIDTVEAREPVAEYGSGSHEYYRAKLEADRRNEHPRMVDHADNCPARRGSSCRCAVKNY